MHRPCRRPPRPGRTAGRQRMAAGRGADPEGDFAWLEPWLGDEKPKHRTREPRPHAWWAAVGLLLLGFVVAWACGVFRVKTKDGVIELVNLPKDSEVLVDGEKVAVTWPGGGEPAVVTVNPGKHKIKVKKDGIETSGDEVTVGVDSKEKFTVRFVPPAKLIHELPKVDGPALD